MMMATLDSQLEESEIKFIALILHKLQFEMDHRSQFKMANIETTWGKQNNHSKM